MRYLITSKRTEAKIILGYDQDGLLCEVQVQDVPEPAHRLWSFHHAPLREAEVPTVFGQPHLKHTVLNVTFEEFWKKYDYKKKEGHAEGMGAHATGQPTARVRLRRALQGCLPP